MPRPANVYDVTSLQVHAEGRRVKQYKDPRPTSVNAQSYRIAKDAGGLPTKLSRSKTRKKRRRSEYEGSQEGEDFSIALDGVVGDGQEGATATETDVRDEPGSSKGAKRAKRAKDPRTKKKRQYEQNLDYLHTEHPPTLSPDDPAWSDFPSSDLLKNIHYHAAQYYSSRGQLYNYGQQVRKAAYKRKREKSGKATRSGEDGDDEDPLDDQEDLEDPGGSPSTKSKLKSKSRARLVREGILEKLPPQKGKYKKVATRRKEAALKDRMGNWEPDMYKMMDGSALICLGMLMQEFVRWQVRPRVPEGWEDDEDGEMHQGGEGEEVGQMNEGGEVVEDEGDDEGMVDGVEEEGDTDESGNDVSEDESGTGDEEPGLSEAG